MSAMRSLFLFTLVVVAAGRDLSAVVRMTQTDGALCGDIVEDMTLSGEVSLTCQTFVGEGATLTIEPGTTIKASNLGPDAAAAALIVSRGAKIVAEGTADAPITFTTALPIDPNSPDFMDTPHSGLWGGLVILGNAPVYGDVQEVEGIAGALYGGNNPQDNSGSLRYVRVWYGGSEVGAGNEINGITFGGVGAGTTVEHIEVAFNLDDGVEFFGGNVNVKYLTVLFVGDDAIDTDQGYQGTIDHAFVLVGKNGDKSAEMDGKNDGQPRSHPQLYNALMVGGVMRLREGTGGQFADVVVTNVGDYGVQQDDCHSEVRSHERQSDSYPDYLYWSAKNVVNAPTPFMIGDGCEGLTAADQVEPMLVNLPADVTPMTMNIDPRPAMGSPLLMDAEGDHRGAFEMDGDVWNKPYSWLAEYGRYA